MSKQVDLLTSLTKDLSKGVQRIVAKPEILNGVTKENLDNLINRLVDYSPKSSIGRVTKGTAIEKVQNAIDVITFGKGVATKDNLDKQAMIEKRSSVLFIKIPQPGFTKCVDTEKFITDAIHERTKSFTSKAISEEIDIKRHKITQFMYGKEFLKPLVKQRTEFLAWLDRHAVDSVMLGADNYLVPAEMISMVIDKIEALEVERNQLLDNFQAQFPAVIEDAKKRLGEHFIESNYSDFNSQVRTRFYPKGSQSVVEARWRSINPSEALKEVSKAAYEKEREKASVDWEDTFGEIRTALREGFVGLVTSFTESLGNDENGKPRVFHASKVEHLKDFIATFGARDLTNDADLEAVVAKAQELITSVDPSNIRKDKDFRKTLADSFEAIKDESKKLTIVRTRKLDLDD